MSQEQIRVLLVEDNQNVANTMSRMLTTASQPDTEGRTTNFSIQWVDRLQSAISQLGKNEFDAILLDLSLPDSDRLDTFARVHEMAPETPIVVLTATDDDNLALQAVQAGAQDFLIKVDVTGGLLARALRYAIERQRVEAVIRARNQELTRLNRATQSLVSSLDVELGLTTFLEETRHLLNVDICAAWLLDKDTGELVCEHAAGPNHEALLGWRLQPQQGVAGTVAATGKTMVVPDVLAEPRYVPHAPGGPPPDHRSILCVPLRVSTGVIGVMQAMATAVDAFRQSDVQLLELLAPTAAVSITNAEMYRQARQDAIDLRTQNEELDAFAHTVAHDLKNPLANVQTFAELLREETAGTDISEDHTKFIAMILQNSHKMNAIIEELLLLAGVRQMDIGMLEPLEMPQIVDGAIARLHSAIANADAQITVPPTWPTAFGYAPWIEEVWVNYISNAVRYGGKPPMVKLGANQLSKNRVVFWVEDDGPGMAKADQERLFTPFTRLDQVSTKGHGLGLSIVRRIVEKLGGSVGVESEPGKGSTFYFILPSTPQ